MSLRREGCSSNSAYEICHDISVIKTAVALNKVAKLVLKFLLASQVSCTTNLYMPFLGNHARWL